MSVSTTTYRRARTSPALAVLLLLLTLLLSSTAHAQLSGTYIVGTGGTFTTIDAAIVALQITPTVTGPVTIQIRGGTYAAPAGGWTLPAKIGMSTTNRITIRPYPGESVTLTGAINPNSGIINVAGSYYTIDGSNIVGGTGRNLRILNTSTIGGNAVTIVGNSDDVIVRNTTMQSAANSSYGTGGGNLMIMGTGAGAPDNTLIESNTIGDSAGILRTWINVFVYSQSSITPVTNTTIRNNTILNTSNNLGENYNCYQIANDYFATGTTIQGNFIHHTVASASAYHYGIAVFDANGYSANATINGNRMRTAHSIYTTDYNYPIYLYAYGSNGTTHRVTNNFIMGMSNTATHFVFGYIYVSAGVNTGTTIDVLHNTFYSAGVGTDYQYGLLRYEVGGGTSPTLNFRNNLAYSTRTSGGFYHMYLTGYGTDPMVLNSSDNVYQSSLGLSYYVYQPNFGINTSYGSLASWQAAGYDQRSFATTPNFVNASNHDLHLTTSSSTLLEGRGFQTGLATDIDGNARATAPYRPDIGADEGNFIGTGLSISQPVINSTVTAGFQTNVVFATTRPMNVRVEFSTNNGATWLPGTNVAPTATGTNVVSVMSPNVATTTARVRVINNLNGSEVATSGAFTLVQPVFTMVAPNGGEIFVPTDVVNIQWTSQFVPSGMPVELQYSVDGGTNWLPIVSGIASQNTPSINSRSWTVPNTPSSNVRFRIKPVGVTTLGDVSNSASTIMPMPTLTIGAPLAGNAWYVGQNERIEWTSQTVTQVRVEYSTNDGASWKLATTGTDYVPAYHDGYDWTIPDEPAASARIRLTSVERPQITTTSSPFSIVKGQMAIDAPNGGEVFDLGEHTTIAFRAPTSTRLDLMFSSDGGTSWANVNPTPGMTIPAAAAGAFEIDMPTLPTKRGLFRLVDADRPWLFDETDAVFEIQEEPNVAIFSPAEGDQIRRGTPTTITWQAQRIDRVNIDYSATGGVPVSSYQRIASGVDASVAMADWSVPQQTTMTGKLRFTNMSGQTVAESGIFSVVDAPVVALRVDGPNGGERFDAGDRITVRWNGTNVPMVSVRFSSDGGTTWNAIATNVPAILRQVEWIAPDVAGARYRVAVESLSPAVSDMSDADFEIVGSVAPTLALTYPSGGERLTVGDTTDVTWAMTGLDGPVTVYFQASDTAAVQQVVSLPPGTMTTPWIVPDAVSTTARIIVSSGTLSDSSSSFEIAPRPIPSVAVTSPNGRGIVWREGEPVSVTWQFQVIENVDIMLSTDGGATWGTTIAQNVPSSTGSYAWTVPHIADTALGTLLVRVATNPGGTPADESDTQFMYEPSPSGAGEITGLGHVMLLGAFPNPFATTTELRWIQRTVAQVSVRVYDLAGTVVAEKSAGMRSPGEQQMSLDAGTMPSGVYIYELRIGNDVLRSMMTLAR